jgi:hypothetical protein
MNRRFERTYRVHYEGDKNRRPRNKVSRVLQFLVAANVIPTSPILVTLVIEAIRSSETSVLKTRTRRSIPEDSIQLVL